ncbi:MAG TPA: CHRD domain-containing protein [Gammaproteobacteria bacterium]|nr:CHRD domain-containing protein [Gammaproteobacteria bacterium]
MRGAVYAYAAGLGLALGTLLPAAAQESQWHAQLARVPIDATTAAKITGHGEAAAELRGHELRITGSFEQLAGAATRAELHEGAYKAVRGKTIAELGVSQADSGTISASLQLTAEQIDALRTGRLYIEIHSQRAPDGDLWGWLLQ